MNININLKKHIIWKCNRKDKGGYYLADPYSAKIKNEYVDEDNRTALGIGLLWLVKLGISAYTQQWWIMGCGI